MGRIVLAANAGNLYIINLKVLKGAISSSAVFMFSVKIFTFSSRSTHFSIKLQSLLDRQSFQLYVFLLSS